MCNCKVDAGLFSKILSFCVFHKRTCFFIFNGNYLALSFERKLWPIIAILFLQFPFWNNWNTKRMTKTLKTRRFEISIIYNSI